MSIRIYSGLAFGDTSLESLLPKLISFKNSIQPIYETHNAEHVSRLAHEQIDLARLEGRDPGSPLFDAVAFVMKREEEAKKDLRHSFWDVGFEIAVIPHKGRIYGISYTQRPKFREALMNSGLVRSYWYGDQGDKPEDVGDAEWAERAAVWDAIVEGQGHYQPGRAGYIFDASPHAYMAMAEDVLRHAPSLEKRARHIALKTQVEDPSVNGGILDKAKAFAKAAEARIPEIAASLREVTAEDLHGKPTVSKS